MVIATNNQHSANTVVSTNTACKPCAPNIPCTQPPAVPPTKMPRNWELEYTPIAVPLLSAGAALEISDGKLASSKLKAAKKTSKPAPIDHKLWWASSIHNCPMPTAATAAMNTAFILQIGRASCRESVSVRGDG